MRKSAYLLLFTCASAFIACTEDIVPDSPKSDATNIKRIVAVINEPVFDDEASTRTVYNNSTNKFVWAISDTIGIFPTTGDQVSFPINKEQANQATVDFNGGGWDLKADSTYFAYFPFDRKNYWGYNAKNAIKISFTGQKQTGKNNADFAKSYPLVSYGVNNNGNVHFSFNHIASFGVFTITSPVAATFTKAILATEDGGNYFIQEGTYDLSKTTASSVPSIKAKTYGASITLNLVNVTASKNESFVIFMTVPPTQALASKVKLRLVDSSGNVYSGNPINPADRNKDDIAKFNAGTRYRRSFTLESEGMFILNTENDDFSTSEEDNVNMKQ